MAAQRVRSHYCELFVKTKLGLILQYRKDLQSNSSQMVGCWLQSNCMPTVTAPICYYTILMYGQLIVRTFNLNAHTTALDM